MKKTRVVLILAVLLIVSAFSLSGCSSKATGITVEANPTKTVYDIGEALNLDGIKIVENYAKGDVELPSDKYTVDSSAFDNTKAGEYTIKVTDNGNSELTAEFKVTVRELTSLNVSLKYNNLILYERPSEEDVGLTVEKVYSNGDKVKVTDAKKLQEEFTYSLVAYPEGTDKDFTVSYKENSKISGKCLVNIYDEDDLTLLTLRVSENPIITKYAFGEGYITTDGVKIVATYDKIGAREVEIESSYLYFNYDEVLDATEPGTYKVYINKYGCADVKTDYSVELVDVSEYTLDSIKLSEDSTPITKYFTNEIFSSKGLTVLAVYKKEGSPDIEFIVSDDNYYAYTDFATPGEKTVTIELDDDNTKTCSYKVTVTDITPLSDGTYYMKETMVYQVYGVYFYDPYFKVENGVFSFWDYVSKTFITGFTLDSLSRSADYDTGEEYLEIEYYNEVLTTWKGIAYKIDGTGLIDTYVKSNATDAFVKIENDLFGGGFFLAENGKLNQKQYDMLTGFGDLYLAEYSEIEHKYVRKGEILDINKVYQDGDVLVTEFVQQDATGQSFIGWYDYTSGDNEFGSYLYVGEDGIYMAYTTPTDFTKKPTGTPVFQYRFTVKDGTATFTTTYGGTATITGSTFNISALEYTAVFTKHADK